jgi:hypothetical protein
MITACPKLPRTIEPILYRIIAMLTEKGVAFKVTDDPTIDTTSRTSKLVMGAQREFSARHTKIALDL